MPSTSSAVTDWSAKIRSGGSGAAPSFRLGLALVILVALLLRLVLIERYPLSMDEAFARYWSEFDHAFLWGEGRRLEFNPPLYFSLLRAWTALFGFSDLSLRLTSALASLGPVLVAGLIGRRLLGAGGGLFAAAAAALMPKAVWHGLDARPAAFVVLFESVALWASFTYLDRLEEARFTRARRAALVALFAVASVLSVHTHVSAVFATASLGLCSVVALLARGGRNSVPDVLLWAGGGIAILLLSLPQILIYATQSAETPLTVDRLGGWWWYSQSVFAPLLLGTGVFDIPPLPRLAMLGLFFAVASAGALRLRGRAHWSILVAFPVVYTAVLILVSMQRAVLFPRMLLIILVPLSVFLAAAVSGLRSGAARAALAGLICLPMLVGHWAQWNDPVTMGSTHSLRHEYRDVVRFLASGTCRGDIYAGHPWNLWGWPHYGPPPAGSRLYGVRYAEELDIDADYALSRFAARHGVLFLDRVDFFARADDASALIVLIGRTARARTAMEADVAALSARFAVTRHDFGVGNNQITVYCLTRRGE